MKILKLDNNSKKNLLEDLLKRSPNNYGQYAGVVDEVLNNVKNNGDKALFVGFLLLVQIILIIFNAVFASA